jgi:hypothetical protein
MKRVAWHRPLWTVGVGVLGVCVSATVTQAQNIDTGAPTTLAEFPVGQSGGSRTSVGQSFTVGSTATTLTSLGFNWVGNIPIAARAYVFGWDPVAARTTGSVLWTSDPVTAPPCCTPAPLSFVTPPLALTSGQTYIAILSAIGFYPAAGIIQTDNVLGTGGNTYAGGSAYTLNNAGNDVATLSGNTWSDANQDLAFRATFVGSPTATVPEPSTFALAAIGLLALGSAATRRRNAC